jgi:peptidoglycan/LPS O-acetylase OafA/YrhL
VVAMQSVGERAKRSARRGAGAPRSRPPKLRVKQRLQAMEGLAVASARAGEMSQRAYVATLPALAGTRLPVPGVAPAAPTGAPLSYPATPVVRRPATRRHRVLALDGLRGIGIAAVIAYHLNPSWLPGGYLGVDVFFVVSGFLITGILMDLFARPGSLGSKLRDFWGRRVRRLVPALAVLCVGVVIASAAFAHDAMPRLRADIPAALGFVANWRLLFHHDSYFELMGRPPLLLHLWSLGVEEQFYLVWPWVVLALVSLAKRPARAIAVVASLGALASALAMAILFVPGHDPSNVYYNTFTHSAGLMIGAALVAATRAWPGGHAEGSSVVDLSATPVPARSRWADVLGGGALAGLAVLLVVAADQATFSYRGGIFLASGLVGLAIWAALRAGAMARLLSCWPLRYLGTRSYSLYLWHWPVVVLTRANLDVRFSGAPLLLLRLVLMGALAEGSYRFVEQPFRTGRAQAAFGAWRLRTRGMALGTMGLAGAAVVALLALVNPPALPPALAQGSTAAARLTLPPASATAAEHTTASSSTTPATVRRATPSRPTSPAATPNTPPASPPPTHTTPTLSGTPNPPPSLPTGLQAPSSAPSSVPTVTAATHHSAPPAAAQKSSPLGHDVLAIGDSVLLAASSALTARLHGDITVDAVVGRQCWAGISRLAAYRQAGDLVGLKALILDLGTNGPMTPADIAQIRTLAAGVPLLIFINVRVDRPWQSETNASLAAVAGQPGIRVINWYAASAAPGLLWPDGIHPDPAGAAVFASLVASALGQ